jgi:hypothetical protein
METGRTPIPPGKTGGGKGTLMMREVVNGLMYILLLPWAGRFTKYVVSFGPRIV